MSSQNEASRCAWCAADLSGPYCARCGEMRLHPEHDFALRHFVAEAVEGFSHFDSRFFRTLRLLMLRPGQLTAEFVAGRRVGYMRPLSLFFVVALLFYVLFPTVTSFYANPQDLQSGAEAHNVLRNVFQTYPAAALAARAAEHGQPPGAYTLQLAQEHAAPKSKAWLFVVAPLWGLCLWALLGWRQRWLVPHWVFAVHGLAFFMLLDLLALGVLFGLFRLRVVGDGLVWFLLACMTLWCVLAVRRVHALPWWQAVPVGAAAALAFFAILAVYRQVITMWVIWNA